MITMRVWLIVSFILFLPPINGISSVSCSIFLPKWCPYLKYLYMGAKVYNELPLDIRQTEIYKEFVEKLKMHFI